MYKHLTSQQRYTIDVLLQKKTSIKEIANTINVHYSTIYRELKRNKGAYHYHHGLAQRKSDYRKHRMRKPRRFTLDMRRRIFSLIISEQWSPEQVRGWLLRKGEDCVSIETIYQYIRFDKQCGGELYTHCRHRLKHVNRAYKHNYNAIKDRIMIDEREPDADGNRFGDWEMDLIIGKDGKGAILTLVERSKDYLVMKKLKKGKNAKEVAKTVVSLLTPFIGNIKTITTDNGSEFAEHRYIAKRLKTKVYFAHPYSSWEKGNIENTNKLIRQYIPKGTDFEKVEDDYLNIIQKKINRRPRKKLNFSSPTVDFYNQLL